MSIVIKVQRAENILFLSFAIVGICFTQLSLAEIECNLGSDLPVVQISTEGNKIVKDNSIPGLLYESTSLNNMQEYPQSSYYNQRDWQTIKVKLHGNFSMSYKQKSYQVKFTDFNNKTIAKGFNCLPEGEAWTFHAPYVDRSLMRNAFAYKLGRELGESSGVSWFAPRGFYTEVMVNRDYKGVYYVAERGEKGKNRVDIPKTELKNPQKVSFIAEISGRGYEFKTKHSTELKYRYPDLEKFAEWNKENPTASAIIKDKIKLKIERFEDVLLSDYFADPNYGYAAYINVESFIDYILMQELSKNIDGYRRSIWFSAIAGGKITIGPIWDFDAAFGNINLLNFSKTNGWLIHRKVAVGSKEAFWFDRLIQDPAFVRQLTERYISLRQSGSVFSVENITSIVDNFADYVSTAAERHKAKWKGTYINPILSIFIHAHPWGTNYQGNVNQIKTWTLSRLEWMDAHINDFGQE